MKCHFCPREATHVCSFKQPDARIVTPTEIQELDIVRDDLTLTFMTVKKIHVNGGDYATLKFAGDKRKIITRSMNVRLPCLRMEIHACGLQVCENHIREVDDGLSICTDHWPVGDFEKVYGTD